MYRQRLVDTEVSSDGARRLQRLLIDYHDFRQHKKQHPLLDDTYRVTDWQAQRLKATHQDLYEHPGYHIGLEFLLTDLYAPTSMTQRDDNIDRVFPKMVKWLPERQLDTLAGLVELNLVTQQLDLELTEYLTAHDMLATDLSAEAYCEAYRLSRQPELRERQIDLVEDVGLQLERYVRNRTLGWLLSIGKTPAEMAGLEDLHSFLHRGYSAFRQMDNVEILIRRLVRRETRVMENILQGHPDPFTLPGDL
ncbi:MULTISPECIES: FFLEELY motif protein [Marinobacter]|uniref:DUF8198 domain-containing protein n=1 Tax=Marinobacter suaedae TaxID=3057675 RepID=A0ABT8VYF3_9GAMM|nr:MULTISPECIES: hypothetical protein [unclassified Marinobacter]MBZ2169106.1 hypothetical protein [Marinobacter sp. F4216]MDO3720975.1 hypothetical protein [Marinobacter sp. chi1]